MINGFYTSVWNVFLQIMKYVNENEIVRLIIIFGPLSVVLHWIATQLYISLCVTPGFWGLINSFVYIITPQCIVISTLMNYTFYYYSQIWKYMIGALIMCCSSVLKKIILK